MRNFKVIFDSFILVVCVCVSAYFAQSTDRNACKLCVTSTFIVGRPFGEQREICIQIMKNKMITDERE